MRVLVYLVRTCIPVSDRNIPHMYEIRHPQLNGREYDTLFFGHGKIWSIITPVTEDNHSP